MKIKIILSILVLTFAYSCQNTYSDTNMTMVAKLDSTTGGAVSSKMSFNQVMISANPSTYILGIVKADFLRDSKGNINIFDATQNPADLAEVTVSDGAQVEIESISLEPGTYSGIEITLLAIGQTISYSDTATPPNNYTANYILMYTNYDNTDGSVSFAPNVSLSTGDFLLDTGATSTYSFMNYGACDGNDPTTNTTPNTAGNYKIKPSAIVSNVRTISFSNPFTIEENKFYEVELTFGAKNTFTYEDVNGNSSFEPTSTNLNGDCINASVGTTYRINSVFGPDFTISMPTITAQVKEK